MTKPSVGQKVILNDTGLTTIWGNALGLSHMKTKVLTLTHVDAKSITFPKKTYLVEVDDPEINSYFLNNTMFDIVG